MLVCITASGTISAVLIQDLISDFFGPYVDKEIKQDAEEADLINQILEADIPVYDLSRGMYPRMPLDGSEKAVEPRTSASPSQGKGSDSETLTDLLSDEDIIRAQWVRYFQDCTLEDLKGIEEELRHAIHVKSDIHPERQMYVNGRRDIPESVNAEQKKYFQSPTGKLRLAGPRSKIRTKEVEVWLTDEEYESKKSE